jgi:hypothetical protein
VGLLRPSDGKPTGLGCSALLQHADVEIVICRRYDTMNHDDHDCGVVALRCKEGKRKYFLAKYPFVSFRSCNNIMIALAFSNGRGQRLARSAQLGLFRPMSRSGSLHPRHLIVRCGRALWRMRKAHQVAENVPCSMRVHHIRNFVYT